MVRAAVTTEPLTKRITTVLVAIYTLGFVLVWLAVGLWEAVRSFAAEGLILFLWLVIAHRLLGNEPVVRPAIKKPAWELTLGLVTFAVLHLFAYIRIGL